MALDQGACLPSRDAEEKRLGERGVSTTDSWVWTMAVDASSLELEDSGEGLHEQEQLVGLEIVTSQPTVRL